MIQLAPWHHDTYKRQLGGLCQIQVGEKCEKQMAYQFQFQIFFEFLFLKVFMYATLRYSWNDGKIWNIYAKCVLKYTRIDLMGTIWSHAWYMWMTSYRDLAFKVPRSLPSQDMVPELDDLRRKNIFSEEEIRHTFRIDPGLILKWLGLLWLGWRKGELICDLPGFVASFWNQIGFPIHPKVLTIPFSFPEISLKKNG